MAQTCRNRKYENKRLISICKFLKIAVILSFYLKIIMVGAHYLFQVIKSKYNKTQLCVY